MEIRTKFELFSAFVNRNSVFIKGFVGRITAIELEDGSGSSFNVTLRTDTGNTLVVYLRTND